MEQISYNVVVVITSQLCFSALHNERRPGRGVSCTGLYGTQDVQPDEAEGPQTLQPRTQGSLTRPQADGRWLTAPGPHTC